MTTFLTPRRLPARTAPLVTAFLLSILMTCIVSCIATLLSLGATSDALWHWPRAWGFSWIVAFPTLLLVLPLVRRAVARIVAPL
ncbi:hypothetical protein NS228_03055 [Methylobacterium indicum]|uniref:DUF2798 domain-containing protein n=1 Tax=Methylobacterium indicum TaxID=1775910 RepID=UPI0007344E01|nr:DUF2798 domain-containing protein [Methylobacterium indicum]KTS24940.1 hypothetical protein NS229_21040 [Methylobacterium indicum]KTS42257.1 hypothetical protein NS228_03055 [Methylobacterium indicum]KTS54102.1 hypothetical protein NS230_02840 [Methylobacterium indicum]